VKWPRSIPWRAAPAPAAPQEPTLKLGDMKLRLRHHVGEALLRELGFPPVRMNGSYPVYRESDWPLICAAISSNALNARHRKGS